MTHYFNLTAIGAVLGIIGTTYGFLRWAFAGTTAFRANSKFVHDMGTNHLPHIYAELTHISYKLGEEPKQPPPIKFVD